MSPSPNASDPLVRSNAKWTVDRIRRHIRWAREQGIGRLIEEDNLDPFERIPTYARKLAWRLSNDVSPDATPVFVVGVQRSGTNMVVRGFERSPEFEVHNESDRAAFHRFRLRPDPVIRALVERSPHRFVLFKPLCDSHRIGPLLDDLGTPTSGKAIWAYRSVDGRVRSSLAKFGDASRRALQRIASGTGDHLWQAQGLSTESLELIRSFEYERLSPASASALFWYVRNAILFEQGLTDRPDVAVVSYDGIVAAPVPVMRSLCLFLGVEYDEALIRGIERRGSARSEPLSLEPRIRERCDELSERLDAAALSAQASKGRPRVDG